MAIPVGYRKINSNDVGKTFGVDLETVIKFDDTISIGSWYINAEPPFSEIEWIGFSDTSNFISYLGGDSNFWMVDTFLRGSLQSISEGAAPYINDYIAFTSGTVPSGMIIENLWTLDTTWMNYVYVKDKESDPEYTITFNGNGGTSPSSRITTNQKLTSLPSSTRTNYVFQGWYTATSGGTKITTSTVFSAHTTIYAQWIPIYTITFNGNGGTSPSSQKTTNQKLTSLPSSTRTGYHFSGWYTATSGGTKITTSTVFSANTTVYARWILEDYTIRFYDYNNSVVASFIEKYYGESITLPTPPARPGYTFDGWYDSRTETTYHGYNGSGTQITWTTIPDLGEWGGEYDFYAKYTPKQYILYYSYGFEYSSTVTYNEPYNRTELNSDPNPRAGYNWVGWFDASSGGNEINSTSLVKVVTTNNYIYAYARWTQDPVYTITFSDTKGNTTTRDISSPQNYKVNPLPSASAVGFDFQGWYTATSGGTRITINTIFNANTTVYAQWKPIYTITFDGREGTSPSSQPVYVEDGYKLTSLPSSTRTNYVFQGWYTATSGGTKITTSTVFSANTTVYAQWKGTAYTVQFYSNGGGVSSPSSKTVYFGETYGTLATVSRSGYGFVGWFSVSSSSGGTQVTPSTVVTTTSPKNLYARWSLTTYTVTYNSNGGSAVPKTFGVTALPTPLPIPTRSNYTFSGWYYDSFLTNPASAGDLITSITTLYADWARIPYTLTYIPQNGQSTTSTTVYADSQVYPTLPTPARANYNFNGWYTAASGGTKIYAGNSFPSSNTTIYAQWTEITYILTYNPQGGSVSPTSATIYAGTNKNYPSTLPTPARTNYNFKGWYTASSGGSLIVAGSGFPSSNTTIYAQWTIMPILTYNSNGGTTYSTIYTNNIVFPSPNPTRANYTFSGWYINSNFATAATNGSTITSNTTIYAKWTEITYTLTYDARGGNTPSPTTIYATNQIYPSLPSSARTNYNFNGWYTAASGGYQIAAGNGFPSSNTTIYAQWTIMPILTYNSNGGTTYSTIYTNNIVFPASNPTRANYIFGGWYINSNFATAATNGSTILTNTTIYAKWTEITYTLSYNATGGNTPSPNTIYATNRVYPSLPSSALTGYTFKGWYLATSGGSPITAGDTFPTSNTTLYAQWTINQYTLTFKSDGVTISTITQNYNTVVTAPTPSKTGHTFTGWNTTIPTNMPASNNTYTAQWTTNQYTITFDTGPDATLVPSIKEYYGTAISDPMPPFKSGYTFTGWSRSIPSTMPAENFTTYAQWQQNFTLTYNSNGGTTYDPILVKNGLIPTLPSPTRNGYSFNAWYYNSSFTGNPMVSQSGMTKNETAYAKWTPINYTINFIMNNATSAQISSITQGYETSVSAPSNPTRTGYTFTGWSPSFPSTMPLNGRTCTAQWVINQYTIVFNGNGGSTPASKTQDYNSAVTAPANPTKTGHTFTVWVPAVPTTMPLNGITCYAQWDINKYIITFDSAGGSTVAPKTQDFGTTITTPTPPTKTGYTFNGWSPVLPSTMPAANNTHTAQWTINQYTITFDSAGGSAVAPIIQNYNTSVTAPSDPTRAGYTFTGWNKVIPANMPAESFTITATWQQHYTLIYKSNGGTSYSNEVIKNGLIPVLPVPDKEGYTFIDWYYDDVIFNNLVGIGDEINNTTIIYARWSINSYKLTFIMNGATSTPIQPITQNYNSDINITNPTRTGYTFNGWSPILPVKMPAANNTHTAQWTINRYTVTFKSDGSIISTITQNYNTQVNAPSTNPTKENHTFIGWDTILPILNLTEDTTINAKWQQHYTLTYHSDGGTSYSPELIKDNKIPTLPTPSKANYNFNGWYYDELFTDSVSVGELMNGNKNAYANFTPKEYTITYNSNGGSLVDSYIVKDLKIPTLPIPTYSGNRFMGWYKELTFINEVKKGDALLANTTLYAKWYNFYMDLSMLINDNFIN